MPPVESSGDLESFFDEEEFATVVTTPKGPLKAIFDNAFQMGFTDPGIEGAAPALSCATRDAETLELTRDDPMLLTVRGKQVTYRFVRHEPDGTGVSLLVLRK